MIKEDSLLYLNIIYISKLLFWIKFLGSAYDMKWDKQSYRILA